jgi:AbiV family abortive infection protein
MKVKAIKGMCQLSEARFFVEIARGIELVTHNALNLEGDAESLYGKNSNGYDILMSVACEEAAKALILFDAIRCPYKSNHWEDQLSKFNSHLAKGIYALMCDWEPSSFAEVCKYIQIERKKFYLDGPNDVDWIFYNSIFHSRERQIYVDYVCTEDGHDWISPLQIQRSFTHMTPRVISIAKALCVSGCISASALRLIAEMWSPIRMSGEFSRQELRELNYRMLSELETKDLLQNDDKTILGTIINHLPFPIYEVELTLEQVDIDLLKVARNKFQ